MNAIVEPGEWIINTDLPSVVFVAGTTRVTPLLPY